MHRSKSGLIYRTKQSLARLCYKERLQVQLKEENEQLCLLFVEKEEEREKERNERR